MSLEFSLYPQSVRDELDRIQKQTFEYLAFQGYEMALEYKQIKVGGWKKYPNQELKPMYVVFDVSDMPGVNTKDVVSSIDGFLIHRNLRIKIGDTMFTLPVRSNGDLWTALDENFSYSASSVLASPNGAFQKMLTQQIAKEFCGGEKYCGRECKQFIHYQNGVFTFENFENFDEEMQCCTLTLGLSLKIHGMPDATRPTHVVITIEAPRPNIKTIHTLQWKVEEPIKPLDWEFIVEEIINTLGRVVFLPSYLDIVPWRPYSRDDEELDCHQNGYYDDIDTE